MKYGYARVSTVHQDLEGQLQTLENEGCQKIYSEKFTGTKKDRPQFQELLSKLETGDTLVVTKLDRFARSAVDAIQIIRNLFEKGVKVHVLNMGLVENTPTGRLILTIMSGFAEFERDMIVERTLEGKQIKMEKDADATLGRPKKFKKAQRDMALQLLEKHSYNEVAHMTGISRRTLIRYKKDADNK